MKSNSKYSGVLLAVAVLATTVLKADDVSTNSKTPAAPAAPAAPSASTKLDDLFPDPVIAKGKGFEIKRSRLDEAVAGVRATAMARGRELMPSDLPIIEKTAFDHLLQVQVLKLAVTDADKTKATELADKRFATIKKRASSEEALARQLKTMNLTIEQLHARLVEEAEAEEVLRDKVTVTDDEIKKFYTDNPTDFEEPETVTASHILITTLDSKTGEALSADQKTAKRKIAEDLLKRARGSGTTPGEDFGKLAREYSEDPGVKENGGQYTFHKGQMAPEFEAAAFSLQTNQISDLVQTKYGFHIIKMTAKTPAKKMDLATVTPEIKNYLESLQMEKILPEVYGKLKKEANVVIVDEELKALEESASDATTPAGAGKPPTSPTPK